MCYLINQDFYYDLLPGNTIALFVAIYIFVVFESLFSILFLDNASYFSLPRLPPLSLAIGPNLYKRDYMNRLLAPWLSSHHNPNLKIRNSTESESKTFFNLLCRKVPIPVDTYPVMSQQSRGLICRLSVASLSSCCSRGESSDEEALTHHSTLEEEPVPINVDKMVKYGILQYNGVQLRQWIEDPSQAGCIIPRSTLTPNELWSTYQFSKSPLQSTLYSNYKEVATELELPWVELDKDSDGPEDEDLVYRHYKIDYQGEISWDGWTGPGILVLDNIDRPLDSPAPPISSISQALYQRRHSMARLRYVIVGHVINTETFGLVKNSIYTRENGLDWDTDPRKPITHEPQTWIHGSDEYDALLGSRIGKVVAYLVLGGYKRGTRQITRIVTWPAERRGALMIRFDIETVESAA